MGDALAGALEGLARLGERAISPTSVADILFLWALIYLGLVLLRGTHTYHLKGLGISLALLMMAWVVTELLNLETSNWLLAQVAPLGFIALVVAFQPEIRQSFGQLGQVSLFGRTEGFGTRPPLVHVINELVEAAMELSVRQIGCLVAVERTDDLTDVIETGKLVEAEVSAEMLMSLFFPNAPLHDGAVVLRENRIAAAACLLPLSDRRDLASSLGTRHRAALGLAERSDALVMVVSEETGLISLAFEGELYRGLREEDLKATLLAKLQPAGSGLLARSDGPRGEARGAGDDEEAAA